MSYFPRIRDHGSLQNLWLFVTGEYDKHHGQPPVYDHVIATRTPGVLESQVRNSFMVTFHEEQEYVGGQVYGQMDKKQQQLTRLWAEMERAFTSYSCVHYEIASVTFFKGGFVDILYRQGVGNE